MATFLNSNTYRTYVKLNRAQASSGSFYITNRLVTSRPILSFVQWGAANQARASDAVSAGVWTDVNDFITKPSSGNSMQLKRTASGSLRSPSDWIAAPPTRNTFNVPVELVSFRAQGAAGGVRLRWRTASETGNSGFRLLRSLSESGPFTAVTLDLIAGRGSTPHAADYEYLDESAEPGVLYYYRLEDIAHDGVAKRSETITARAGLPAP